MDDWSCISVFLRDRGLRALRALRGFKSISDWIDRRLTIPKRRPRAVCPAAWRWAVWISGIAIRLFADEVNPLDTGGRSIPSRTAA